MTAAPPARRRVAAACVFLLACALVAHKSWIELSDPNFTGDAGIRLDAAAKPVVRLGNRVWLPWLQLHIWALYQLRAPYRVFGLIPCLYCMAALIGLGLLGLRLLGLKWSGILLSLAAMAGFGQQMLVAHLSVTLYQEVLGAAIFYLLLYGGALELKQSWKLVALGTVGLLTRDTFQIYLFVLTVLHWRAIWSSKTYRKAFLMLWAVPVLWMLSIPFGYLMHDGRLPRSAAEWPLMINKDDPAVSDLSRSAASLWAAMQSARAIWVAAGVTLGVLAVWRSGGRGSEWGRRFAPFSLLSLSIIYGAFLLFDPSKATFGNPRMMFPLMEHAFVWALLALSAAASCGAATRNVARAVVLAGLVLGMSPTSDTWLPRSRPEMETVYRDLERLQREASPEGRPVVCFGPESHFRLIQRFVGPTLYASRRYLPAQTAIPAECRLWISRPEGVPGSISGFEKARTYDVDSQTYEVYRSRR